MIISPKLFFAYLLLFFTQLSISQSSFFNVTETPPFEDVKINGIVLDVYNFDNDEIVVLRQAKKRFLVNDFSSDHTMKSNIEILHEKKEAYLGSIITDDLLRIFTSLKVSKKVVEINCYTHNLTTQETNKKVLYTSVKGKNNGKYSLFTGSSRKHSENFRVSPNNKYIAFAVDNINTRTEKYGIRVFDANLNEVFSKEYSGNEENYYFFDDFVVTNNGEVISAGKLYKEGSKDKKNGKANYEYIIHKITPESATSNKIDLGDNFIKEVRFAQTETNLRMLGFYSERNSFRMKGGISYTFNGSDINNISVKQSPFPAEIYNDIYKKQKAERLKKKEKEFRNYYLDYSIVDEEGNGYLTAEQFYITTTTNNINGIVTTNQVYHYDNILALKFDIEGNLVWGRTILKKEIFPSYQPFVIDNALHILLNTGKNISEKSNGRKKMKKGFFEKLALFDVSFNPTTGEKKMEIIQDKKGRRFYNPSQGSFGYESFIMTNFSKKKRQFLILTKK